MALFRAAPGGDGTELPSHLLTLAALRTVTSAPHQAFTHVRTAPVRVLSHVLGEYMAMLGTAARQRAEAAGRTDCSFADAAGALEELSMSIYGALDYLERTRQAAPTNEAERDRDRALRAAGSLLNNVVPAPRQGKPLSYRLFTEEELLELERAAESAAESAAEDEPVVADEPSPPPSSGSDSSDDDEHEGTRMRIEKPRRPTPAVPPARFAVTKRKARVLDEEDSANDDEAALADAEARARWRYPARVPEHIPPYLPPLPGLASADRLPEEEAEVKQESHLDALRPAKRDAVRLPLEPVKPSEMWRSRVPYERSQLAMLEGVTLPPLILANPDEWHAEPVDDAVIMDVVETGEPPMGVPDGAPATANVDEPGQATQEAAAALLAIADGPVEAEAPPPVANAEPVATAADEQPAVVNGEAAPMSDVALATEGAVITVPANASEPPADVAMVVDETAAPPAQGPAAIEAPPPPPRVRQPPPPDPHAEGSMHAFHKLQQRFVDMPPLLEPLAPTERRRGVSALLLRHRLAHHDTLHAAVPPEAHRQSARSAGWVPYAYDAFGRPSVYLRDFDGPLIDSVSISVVPRPETLAPPAARAPGIMANLVRELTDLSPATASRLMRLGPPGPTDDGGRTVSYALDETGGRLAVAQPPHQNPLYFVPGWYWTSRDPNEAALPKPYEPPDPAVLRAEAERRAAIEAAAAEAAAAEAAAAQAAAEDAARALQAMQPLVPPPPAINGFFGQAEPFLIPDMPAAVDVPAMAADAMEGVQPFAAEPLPAIDDAPAFPALAELGPPTAVDVEAPSQLERTVSAPPGEQLVPKREASPDRALRTVSPEVMRAPSMGTPVAEPVPRQPSASVEPVATPAYKPVKIKLRLGSSTSAAPRQLPPPSADPSPIVTDIPRTVSPAPMSSMASPAPAPSGSAGGFKLKLNFGGMRKSASATPGPVEATPPPPPPMPAADAPASALLPSALPDVPVAPADERPDNDEPGMPFVPMPPPKAPAPASATASPVRLASASPAPQTNGTSVNGAAHGEVKREEP